MCAPQRHWLLLLQEELRAFMTPVWLFLLHAHFLAHCLSPLAHAAQVISDPAFLEGVKARGERLRKGLRSALAGNPHVKEVRGLGLICGVQLDVVRPSCACPPVRHVSC